MVTSHAAVSVRFCQDLSIGRSSDMQATAGCVCRGSRGIMPCLCVSRSAIFPPATAHPIFPPRPTTCPAPRAGSPPPADGPALAHARPQRKMPKRTDLQSILSPGSGSIVIDLRS
jgi:hypothetical protein